MSNLHMCVWVCAREKKCGGVCERERVCVCVCERERGCVCAREKVWRCVRERDRVCVRQRKCVGGMSAHGATNTVLAWYCKVIQRAQERAEIISDANESENQLRGEDKASEGVGDEK